MPRNALLPGERLLWSGRPQRIAPRGIDWYQLAFGVVWVSVAAAITFGGKSRTMYVGAAVAVFGFTILWAPVLWRLWAMRHTVYAVTDRRVVVADGRSGRTRSSAYLRALPPPVTQPGEDGVGTVTFGESGGPFAILGAAQAAGTLPQVTIVLAAVPEAERVRDLIARAQAAG